jgi:hypothetical protein
VFDLVLDCVHAGSGLGFVKLGFPRMRPVAGITVPSGGGFGIGRDEERTRKRREKRQRRKEYQRAKQRSLRASEEMIALPKEGVGCDEERARKRREKRQRRKERQRAEQRSLKASEEMIAVPKESVGVRASEEVKAGPKDSDGVRASEELKAVPRDNDGVEQILARILEELKELSTVKELSEVLNVNIKNIRKELKANNELMLCFSFPPRISESGSDNSRRSAKNCYIPHGVEKGQNQCFYTFTGNVELI